MSQCQTNTGMDRFKDLETQRSSKVTVVAGVSVGSMITLDANALTALLLVDAQFARSVMVTTTTEATLVHLFLQ